jgi:hypothetical protein
MEVYGRECTLVSLAILFRISRCPRTVADSNVIGRKVSLSQHAPSTSSYARTYKDTERNTVPRDTSSSDTPFDSSRTTFVGYRDCGLEDVDADRDELVDGERCDAFVVPFSFAERNVEEGSTTGRRGRG